MLKLKNLILIAVVAISLLSCGEYQKVLNKGKNAERYKLAEELYNKGDYKKAIPLFEKLVGPYAGKPQMERIQYMTADSYYKSRDYSLASYYFTKFIINYPKSSKVEEAAYLSAYSYYLSSPKYSRDQTDTYKALEALQNYINTYPNSKRLADANKYYDELTRRLEKKDFEIAKQYFHTEYYNAAIKSFDIFNEEHLGSVYKEEAMYIQFKAAYELAVKSVLSKKMERLESAREYYEKFKKEFPESERFKEMDPMLETIDKEHDILEEQIRLIQQGTASK